MAVSDWYVAIADPPGTTVLLRNREDPEKVIYLSNSLEDGMPDIFHMVSQILEVENDGQELDQLIISYRTPVQEIISKKYF